MIEANRSSRSSGKATPELQKNLTIILEWRESIGVVSGDMADARTDREGHLDHLIERGLIPSRAQRAVILVLIDGFQGGAGIKHASTSGAEDVPGHVESTNPTRMEESANGLPFVQAVGGSKSERVDAI
jgi:hypothetical protein